MNTDLEERLLRQLKRTEEKQKLDSIFAYIGCAIFWIALVFVLGKFWINKSNENADKKKYDDQAERILKDLEQGK